MGWVLCLSHSPSFPLTSLLCGYLLYISIVSFTCFNLAFIISLFSLFSLFHFILIWFISLLHLNFPFYSFVSFSDFIFRSLVHPYLSLSLFISLSSWGYLLLLFTSLLFYPSLVSSLISIPFTQREFKWHRGATRVNFSNLYHRNL